MVISMTDDIKILEEKLKKASGERLSSAEAKSSQAKKFISKRKFIELAHEVKKIFSEEKNANPRFNLQ